MKKVKKIDYDWIAQCNNYPTNKGIDNNKMKF